MPDNLLETLSENDIRDLVASIGGPGQVPLADTVSP